MEFNPPLSDGLIRAIERDLAGLMDGSRGKKALVYYAAPGREGYVQCLWGWDGSVTVEATSDHFLDAQDRLSVSQLASLARLGWGKARPFENYARDYDEPVPIHEVAELMAMTLCVVFGQCDAESLAIDEID